MSTVLVLSWAARGDGRGRALLSLSEHLSGSHDVVVGVGERSWEDYELERHFDTWPEMEWVVVPWNDGDRQAIADGLVSAYDPDVIIGFDTLTNQTIRAFDRPTIGYCRTQISFGADEYWAPSRALAGDYDKRLARGGKDAPCFPLYPVWYLDEPEPGDFARPIDVMVHGRKARDLPASLTANYNVLVADSFDWARLREFYRRSKLFVFPRPERFEPLGLMPIEAASFGCKVAVPPNSGVAEIYSDHVYEEPTDSIDEALEAPPPVEPVPDSPTDPLERIDELL